MVSLCCVFSRSPCPAGCVPPVCSNIPGCGPLSRERRTSVAAELPSGTKLVWMRSLICLSFVTEPISVCLCPPIVLLSPSFCTVYQACTQTQIHICCLPKERAGGGVGGAVRKHTGHRDLYHLPPCLAFFPHLLTQDKVCDRGVWDNPPVLFCALYLIGLSDSQ